MLKVELEGKKTVLAEQRDTAVTQEMKRECLWMKRCPQKRDRSIRMLLGYAWRKLERRNHSCDLIWSLP